MKMHDYMVAKARIWGAESYACTIVFEIASGKYFAECDSILGKKRLTEKNYEEVLNDMFYDYCCENAAWMGVS